MGKTDPCPPFGFFQHFFFAKTRYRQSSCDERQSDHHLKRSPGEGRRFSGKVAMIFFWNMAYGWLSGERFLYIFFGVALTSPRIGMK